MTAGDCSGPCRSAGTCDCGALLDDTLQVRRVVRVSLALSDSAMQTQVASMTNVLDGAIIDAEAAKPEYDWARARTHADGSPLAQHYARLNLARASAEGQRAEAAHDHYVHKLQHAHEIQPAATVDSTSAYAAMCDQMANAWR